MTFKLVVVGTSLGGLAALKELLSGLTKNFPVPIAIVQHRHKESDVELCRFLQNYTSLQLKEVEDKDESLPGWGYLAPADYHLLAETGYFTLSTDELVSYARPSIDVLFESAADAYAEQVIGVILTGANQDGARGLAKIKLRGGATIVQDPTTAESPTMPQAALAELSRVAVAVSAPTVFHPPSRSANILDWVLPLPAIAPHLVNLCQSGQN